MSYIEDICAKVSHDPLILVGSAVLMINPAGELLMLLPTDNNSWGVPGGMMAPGERAEETARRGTREETGLKLGELTYFGVFPPRQAARTNQPCYPSGSRNL